MAKLSARGRSERWRLVRDYDKEHLDARQRRYNERNGTDFENTWTRERVTYAWMSDGHLLKNTVFWSVNRYHNGDPAMGPKEDRNETGWKDLGKISEAQANETRKKLFCFGYQEKF